MPKSKHRKNHKKKAAHRKKMVEQEVKQIKKLLNDYKPNPEMLNEDGTWKEQPKPMHNPQTSIYNDLPTTQILPGISAKDFEV